MDRPDLTSDLVHYVKGETLDEALVVLQAILRERRLLGGTGYIKGCYRCVCFSEAPARYLGYAILRGDWQGARYQPVGIRVRKAWLFAQGGRPVIYQADDEYGHLPESMRWRHVRYEPQLEPPVDFTWEREWRVRIDELPIDPTVATVIVPDQVLAAHLVQLHEREQDIQQLIAEEVHDDVLAWAFREDWEWPMARITDDILR